MTGKKKIIRELGNLEIRKWGGKDSTGNLICKLANEMRVTQEEDNDKLKTKIFA